GYAMDAILGTFVECSEWGEHPKDPPHLLRRLGFVEKPSFTQRFFEVQLAVDEGNRMPVWIHRSSGELVTAEGDLMAFDEWCGEDIHRGLHYLCQMVESSC